MARNRKPLRPPDVESPLAGQIDYRTAEGWSSALLGDVAWVLPATDLLHVRDPAVYRGQENLPGWYFSRTVGRRLAYESVNERNTLVALDLDATVTAIATQPFRLWLTESSHRFPDILVEHCDGSRCMIDVSLLERLEEKPELRYALDATRSVCEQAGWDYEVITEQNLAPQAVVNRQWFASFRRFYLYDADIAAQLIAACHDPSSICDVLRSSKLAEDDARPVLFHLVATGVFVVDMSEPITNQTAIRLARHEANVDARPWRGD